VGLRPKHYPDVLSLPGPVAGVDWFEASSENYMVPGGRPPRVLAEVRSRFPVALHGVSLNIGSSDPLDQGYLDRLDALARRTQPAWLSDHLCWTGVAGCSLHDLLPLPRTEASASHVVERVQRVQERLRRRIALENISSYLAFQADEMSEWDFLVEVAERADCGILLDVNNVFVSAHNHGFDPLDYVEALPPGRIFEIHLAGASESGPLLIDTHDHPVSSEVWRLYEHAIRRFGRVSTLVEWDDRIPSFATLAAEAARARAIIEGVLCEWEGCDGRPPTGAARVHAG
jgi:hypothetical protein